MAGLVPAIPIADPRPCCGTNLAHLQGASGWIPNDMQAYADRCLRAGRYGSAIAMLLQTAEGDPSLDGGSVGHALGECYEGLGDLHAARYWYGRAVEENPAIDLYRRDFDRMAHVRAEDLLSAA